MNSIDEKEVFEGFPKIPRLFREIVITEKIDGTNAQVVVLDDGRVLAGSRNRFITPEQDNHGFAAWVKLHEDELRTLGPGRHFGEWWGAGIQRRYDQKQKWFSLFNVSRWRLASAPQDNPMQEICPPGCLVVPTLYSGPFLESAVREVANRLRRDGSAAAPGFMQPEGIIVYHTAAKHCFKVTLDNDEKGKAE